MLLWRWIIAACTGTHSSCENKLECQKCSQHSSGTCHQSGAIRPRLKALLDLCMYGCKLLAAAMFATATPQVVSCQSAPRSILWWCRPTLWLVTALLHNCTVSWPYREHLCCSRRCMLRRCAKCRCLSLCKPTCSRRLPKHPRMVCSQWIRPAACCLCLLMTPM